MSEFCWIDRRETQWPLAPCPHGGHDDYDATVECIDGGPHATCLLPHGHGGSHEWTLDQDISIRFASEAPG